MTPRTVLIVDDDEDIVESFQLLLEDEGWQVYTAYSSSQALEIIRTVDVNLVLLDFMLPGIKGDELAFELRKVSPELCILLVTGYSDYSKNALQIDELVNQVLIKPVRDEVLLEKINECRMLKTEKMKRN